MSDLTVASTTDPQEEINRAAGITVKEEPPAPEPKEGEEPKEAAPEPKPKTAYEKRIDRLVRERGEARREAEELKAKLLKFEQALTQNAQAQEVKAETTQETTQAQTPPKPEAKDYATVEEWVAALSDWQTDRKLEAIRAKQAEEQAIAAQEAETKKVHDQYLSRVEEARERYEDFDDYASKDLQMWEGVLKVIREHPNGPDLQYLIGKDRKVYNELINLPWEMAMGRAYSIADQLGREVEEPEEESAAPTRKTKSAPAPIRPVSGSSTKSSVPIDELPYQEYRRIRDQQEKGRYRR